jgi:phytoene synthase
MTGIYRRILDRILEDPAQVLAGRISLSPLEKTWVAARSLVAAGGERLR